jgi:plasmid stability protein
VRLPVALSDQLREAAQRHERSQGAEVRHILRAHVDRERAAVAFDHEDTA